MNHWESLLKQAIDHHAPLKRGNLKSNHLSRSNPAIQNQRRISTLFLQELLKIAAPVITRPMAKRFNYFIDVGVGDKGYCIDVGYGIDVEILCGMF